MAKYASLKELNYEEEIGLNSLMRNVRKLLNHPRYFSKSADDLPKGRGHCCVVGLVQDKRTCKHATWRQSEKKEVT